MFEIFFKVVLIHPFILPYNKHLLGKLNMWYTLPGGFTFNLISYIRTVAWSRKSSNKYKHLYEYK